MKFVVRYPSSYLMHVSIDACIFDEQVPRMLKSGRSVFEESYLYGNCLYNYHSLIEIGRYDG